MDKSRLRVWVDPIDGKEFDNEKDWIEYMIKNHPWALPSYIGEGVNVGALEPKTFPKKAKKKKKPVTRGIFVLDEHIIEGRKHFDLRIKLANGDYIDEYTGMVDNIVRIREGVELASIYKRTKDSQWIDISFSEGIKVIGNIPTHVRRIDQGEAILLSEGDNSKKYTFNGGLIANSITLVREETGYWHIKKEEPTTESLSIHPNRDKLEALKLEEAERKVDLLKKKNLLLDKLMED